jgi:hypothetical protein
LFSDEFLARSQRVFLSFLQAIEGFLSSFCKASKIRFGFLAKAMNFFSSFLLAHCGGGQDKPGLLGPSAKRPGSVFFFSVF